MRRREFITLLGSAAAAWPLAARAQQGGRMRRIGALLPASADDPDYQSWVGAFQQALAQSGWIIGRNVRIDTGFMSMEFSFSGKWLELLREVAPSVTRVAVLRDAAQGTGTSQFAVIQAMAPTLRMEVTPLNVRDADEIERGVTALARTANGGLIVAAGPSAGVHRDLVITLAAQHKLPAVYFGDATSSAPAA